MIHSRKTTLTIIYFTLLLTLTVMAMATAIFVDVQPAAATARDFTWDTAITYQNLGTISTSVQVLFYQEGATAPIIIDPLSGDKLAAQAGRSLYIGPLAPAGFQGSAVLVAKQPLATTAVRFRFFPPGFRLRLLYHGFSDADGADTFIIPTVLFNKWDRTTVLSIQNLEDEAITATIKFYDTDDNGDLAATIAHQIAAQSSLQIEMDNAADTGLDFGAGTPVFNGSAIISATQVDGGGSANIVAAASEYYSDRSVAADFEGVPESEAGTKIQMATALCQIFGLDTSYAVTNVGNEAVNATVNYYDGSTGNLSATYLLTDIKPGAKQSTATCDAVDPEFTGSAVIDVTSGTSEIVALGKAHNSLISGTLHTENFFTVFLGEKEGDSKLAIPFMRWAPDSFFNDPGNAGSYQRSYIAVRNVENKTINITATYYDKDGNICGKDIFSIAARGKYVTNAEEANALGNSSGNAGDCAGLIPGGFGYYGAGTQITSFGGAVVLESKTSGDRFIAINRVNHPGFGEDVNAISVP